MDQTASVGGGAPSSIKTANDVVAVQSDDEDRRSVSKRDLLRLVQELQLQLEEERAERERLEV